jgi:hypothetical protein
VGECGHFGEGAPVAAKDGRVAERTREKSVGETDYLDRETLELTLRESLR